MFYLHFVSFSIGNSNICNREKQTSTLTLPLVSHYLARGKPLLSVLDNVFKDSLEDIFGIFKHI